MRRLRWGIMVVALVLVSSGCKTLDPYTGEEKTSNAAKGAAIGAGIAAVVAYIDNKDEDRRERREKILLSAGVGALAGGAVGHYMDKQEAELRQELEATGVRVAREGDNLILLMPGNVTFDSGKSNVKQSFERVLASVAKVLDEYNKTVIEVAGHTDSVGAASYNQGLSELRARAVGDFLIGQGVKMARVETVGYGETRPIGNNATAAGRAENRRVELTLIPVTDE